MFLRGVIKGLDHISARLVIAERITTMTRVNAYATPPVDALDTLGQSGMIEYKCKDDPEALGRIPAKGEQRFTLIFPLDTGEELKVHMGKESMNHFETFISHMMVDDESERESRI